jgi:cobalt-zinc-cadmium resistance protein CzcA
MIDRLIVASLERRYLIFGLIAIWCAAGWYALSNLNVDAFPDTTPVQVQVNTPAPSLVPEEIERQISFPIEVALGNLPGLEQMRSVSQFGLSQVVITFRDGTDVYFARQLVNERLSNLEMPPGIVRPEMGPPSTGLGEVFHYLVLPKENVQADVDLQMKLRELQDWKIKPELRTVKGTAEANSWGGLAKQYQVRIDPAKIFRYDLTFQQVIDAVRHNNANVGGGNINRGGDMLLVHGVGRVLTVEDIGNIVVKADQGVAVHVRDVADIAIGHEIRRGAVTSGGNGEAVLGLGFMLMGENSYAVTKRMADQMEEVKKRLPDNARVEVVYDRTELVDQVIDTVRKNLSEGAVFVVIILFLFLGDIRAGLVAAIAIPLSMLFAFCGMWWVGVAGTLLSLGAIDFGIVVDSSVVVIESILHKLAHAPGIPTFRQRLAIVRDGVFAAKTPAVFGQLIIMIVYVPILTLEGVEGKMFRPMAITVVFVLLGSLILSLTVIPVLSYFFLPRKPIAQDVLMVRVARWLYGPFLRATLSFRSAVVGLGFCTLLVALMIAFGFGSEFVPRLSEGAIVIGINRPPGTNIDQSIAMNTAMERRLREEFPNEIKHIWSRQGAPEVATDAGVIETCDMFVMLHPRSQWKRHKAGTDRLCANQSELVEEMDVVVQGFVGQVTWFTQPIEMRINEMLSGVRADVAIKLFGPDFDVLTEKAGQISRILSEIRGSADLSKEQILGQPIVQIRINQEEIARYGIPAQQVLDIVESVGAKQVGEVIEGQIRFPLVVRLPEAMRKGVAELSHVMIAAPDGEQIPLSRLATVREISGPRLIAREGGKRRIVVQCNVRGRDIGSFVAEAQKRIDAEVELSDKNYWLTWGGQFENMQRAQRRLAIVVPLALLMIIALLWLTYRNVIDTTLVFASVPFACVGGIVALWVRDMPLSISAAIGFITLSGVSVLGSMVVVAQLRTEPRLIEEPQESIWRAWTSSLRTILMTAFVASVGFVPMAISDGAGAEVQRPLATVVIGGVISSMITSLMILPALYSFAMSWFPPRKVEVVVESGIEDEVPTAPALAHAH